MINRIDAVLGILLGIVECLRAKREAGLKARIGHDVARFAEALAKGDTDTIARMIADLPDNRKDKP